MNITELIIKLESIKEEHGDLEINPDVDELQVEVINIILGSDGKPFFSLGFFDDDQVIGKCVIIE